MTAELGEREEDSVGSLPERGSWNKSPADDSTGAEEGRDGRRLCSGLTEEDKSCPARSPQHSSSPHRPQGFLSRTPSLPSSHTVMPRTSEELWPILSQLVCLFPLSCAFLTTRSFFVSFPSFKHLSGSGLLHLYDEKSHLP